MLADILKGVAAGADALGLALAPVAPMATPVAKIIGLALRSGAKFAEAGKDPVIEIERILKAEPLLKDVEEDWTAHLNKRFPATPAPVEPDDVPTAPPDDDYEG